MKKFIISLLVFLAIPLTVFGENLDFEEYNENLSFYDLSFFDKELDSDSKRILKELKLDEFSYENLYNLKLEDVIRILSNIIKERSRKPLEGICEIAFFIVVSSYLKSLKPEDSLNDLFSTVTVVVISVVLLAKLSSVITLSVTSIKIISDFVYAFVPVFCAIVVASGGITVSFSTNSLLLILSQGMAFLSSAVVMPVINSFLSVGICSSLRPQLGLLKIAENAKRIIITFMSFISGTYVSVLSIKTVTASRADMLGIRSLRFVISSVVPVIGGALSEGLISIQSYSSLIKSSVGIIGIISIILVFLPSIIEIVLWRLSLTLCSLLSDVFNDGAVSGILNIFNTALMLLGVIIILSSLTTVVSIGILIASGN